MKKLKHRKFIIRDDLKNNDFNEICRNDTRWNKIMNEIQIIVFNQTWNHSVLIGGLVDHIISNRHKFKKIKNRP